MSGAIRVLLPPTAVDLVPLVLEAGCTPVVDATGSHPPHVPDGAWVRTRPGRPAPGTGPVILAELGAPVPDRETWLETSAPRGVPSGFAGLVLKGREAGGLCGEEDGLVALSRCPEPHRVLLDAGLGPATAAAAAALGAAGVLLVEPHLGCPEVTLPDALARRLDLGADEVTRCIGGFRLCNGPTAPVLRRLLAGEDPWALMDGVWELGDPSERLWPVGQGVALARELADRYGSLRALLRAYAAAFDGWAEAARGAAPAEGRPVGGPDALHEGGTAATVGGPVGSGVLWQHAAWLDRPVHGGPLRAAMSTGCRVVAAPEALDEVRATLPAPAPPATPTPRVEVVAPTPPIEEEPVVPASSSAPAIAIVGIGCRFPGGADTPEAFWRNIVEGVSAIGEVPPDRWDPSLYFDPNPDTPDRTYTRIGAFLTDFTFDSKRFRIPPKVARQVDPVQQITLACVADALADAGLQVDKKSPGKAFDRERCAVILGNSLGGEVSDAYAIRLNWPAVARALEQAPSLVGLPADQRQQVLAQMEQSYLAGLPIIDEDSMPGELANVIAGRIANAFDLGGANYTVDAACASSMAAIQAAVKGLQDGDHDVAITGGADRSMNIATYVKFCKIGALSPDHSSPFDASANGFVMGEGCGILVLKRYEDAVRDGDRVYAVIRGIGASSDGKGKGITAPNINGQLRALKRAYEAAGFEPWEVDLVEAHGTSTVVGDKVEVEALTTVIGGGHRGDRGPVRVGSVKSMIGHLKSAAGAASCIKTALALHHGVLPPSLGFRQAREDVPLDVVPLQVQTRAEPWPETPNGLRRAGVSAFGFGGTNFHVVMESFAGAPLPKSRVKLPPAPQEVRPAPKAAPPRPAPVLSDRPSLPEGIWATSALDEAELLANLRALADGREAPWDPSAPLRIAAASKDTDERADQLKRAIRHFEKGGNPDMLRARSIHFEDAPFDGKLSLLFTGQGSQYVDMGLDLAEVYPIVRETFEEADRILLPHLKRPITEIIRLSAGEDADAKADVLRRTEYSQPATLCLDIAILRLLAAHGVQPDMVAGHSLGEYGAAVAAGVMTFEQALLAVSARGREMASIRLDDPGKMAGIAASTEAVEAVLAEVDGYVIAANKNCPSQTVIAGASDAVDEACERFRARGVTVHVLPVSHAFHSAIVQPASDPLRAVLGRLGLNPPVRPITTNVTGDYYPSGPGAVERIIDLLAQQISAPVEWIAQMERMYADGARAFVEVGPKRALAGFTVAILKRRPHRALYTNQPKRGGVASFRHALAGLLAVGFPVSADLITPVDIFASPAPRKATTQAVTAYTELHATRSEASPDLREGILRIVAKTTGYDVAELDPDYELEADLGIDTVKQAEVFSVVRSTYRIPPDPDFSFSDHKTLRSLIDWAAERTGATRITVDAPVAADAPAPSAPAPAAPSTSAPVVADDVVAEFLTRAAKAGLDGLDGEGFARELLPAVQGLLAAAFDAARRATQPAHEAPKAAEVVAQQAPVVMPGGRLPTDPLRRVVCTGASLGLPGGDEVFGADNLVAMLSGTNRISHIGDRARDFLDLGLVRLVKDARTGQGSFLPVEDASQVIRLAGTKARFDLREWGVSESLIQALDVTTQLAFAAGLEALRDAGIPLVRTYKTSASGKQVPQGWALPEALRDGTGVIFGSAFPGYDRLVEKLNAGGKDADGHFDRRFLFQVLSMGHSQFAQLIGARGPNTAVNAACASTTQALDMAADWIKLGRCERVIVVGADDVTSENLLPWIGGGFMAAGAATTKDVVEEAALPFDRRRHGLILGMGAVGLVVESAEAAEQRAVIPVAEYLGGSIVNSAFHGTRLDTEHIADELTRLVDQVCAIEGIRPEDMAVDAMFMSHETYTPARGGSAGAEINALRRAFRDAASRITIANTKGYTGHPMGAGIEDTVVVKSLQYGMVPPVANLAEPDEELGVLHLSRGERRRIRYAVRLAAGFGSQLALTIWKAAAKDDERVADERRRAAWLREITGYRHVAEVVEERTLRVKEDTVDRLLPIVPEMSPVDHVHLPEAAPATTVASPAAAAAAGQSFDEVLAELTAVIAGKTGYEPGELEPDFELEADLGIDTVKQAEIFSELTEKYGLQRDDDFKMADYPTIEALAGYLSGVMGAGAPSAPAPVAAPAPAPAAPAPAAAAPAPAAAASAAVASGSVYDELVAVIAEKTGYEPHELESDFELEADLGIDTVKQAEIFSDLTAKYGLQRDDDFKMADYPTIEALAGYLDAKIGGAAPVAAAPAEAPVPTPAPVEAPSDAGAPEAAVAEAPVVLPSDTYADLVAIVADRTGYEPHELEPDFELEADLGVDTVKQAEILSALQDRYALPPDEDFRLADHPTLAALAAYLDRRRGAVVAGSAAVEAAPESAMAEATAIEADLAESADLPPSFRIRRPVLVDRPCEVTGSLSGRRVRVLGDGPVAERIRVELQARGASLDEQPDTVIDAADDVTVSFAEAKGLDGQRLKAWITVTRLGELGGIYPLDRGFTDGARAGFTKSLGREWEGCLAKVVDLPSSAAAEEVARVACDELLTDTAPEVFVRDGRRRVVQYRVEERPSGGEVAGSPVVLVTGGGRGICARIALELARRFDVKLALVGRAAIPEEALDEAAEKARIKAALQAAGERVTPARIEQQLAPLRKGDEVRRNIEEMRGCGRRVEYFQADMADPAGVPRLVEEVETALGPVAVVIHGAGVEESRLLADKDEAAFHRVFDGKALGGRALVDALPDAYFLSMGSVAGRFGNPGQVDYAAANDALARICLTRPRSLHVDWTAWGDVGMAVRGGMKHVLESRGVELLPADAGAALVADLIAAGTTGEIVVAGKLGDFSPPPPHPLLDRVEMDGDLVRAWRELSVAGDPWMLDHAIDGVAVLPGVIGLELMAATAQLVSPGSAYVGARNVRFDAPVKVHGDRSVTVLVEAEPTVRPGEIRARLISIRELRTGKVRRTEHFRATILLGEPREVDSLPSAFLPDEPVTKAEIYRRFFHGPIFQVLNAVFGVSVDGLIAEGAVEPASIADYLVTAPLTLEAAFQAAGLHRMIVAHTMGLPMEIEEVLVAQPAPPGEPFSLMVQLDAEGLYHVDVDGLHGPLLRLRGFAMVDRGPVPDGDRFAEPEGGRPTCFPARTSARSSESTSAKASADEDARAWLTDEELDELRARGTERRIRDRVAGRIAAKRALVALTGVEPHAIRVRTAASGEPVAEVPGDPDVRVSISHREGHAVAVAVRGQRVGVDLERVEPRPTSFGETWFTDAERALVAGDPQRETVVWAVKEAVLKVLGTGMALSPREVVVEELGDHSATVALTGEAAARHAALGGAPLTITWQPYDDAAGEVLIQARMAA